MRSEVASSSTILQHRQDMCAAACPRCLLQLYTSLVCLLPLQMHTHAAPEWEMASASTIVQHRLVVTAARRLVTGWPEMKVDEQADAACSEPCPEDREHAQRQLQRSLTTPGEAEPVRDAWHTGKVRVQHQSQQGIQICYLRPTPSAIVMMGMLLGFCRLFEGASGTTKGPSSAWTAAESPKVWPRFSVTSTRRLAAQLAATCCWPASDANSHSCSRPCSQAEAALAWEIAAQA